jgi:nucleotide-binding universal stress UspA family protein
VTKTLDRVGTGVRRDAAPSAARPVLLATLDAPLLEEAARIAVDAAVESGQPLLVVNAVESTLTRCDLTFLYVAPPDVEESLNTPAALAKNLGAYVERICLRSPRPVEALLELASEREVGLLVLGPDPDSMRRGRYRRCVRKVRDRSPCLVWVV